LLKAAAGAAVAFDLLAVFGCAAESGRQPAQFELPLDQLPPGRRVRVLHGELPVELLRSEAGVTATLLQCTHMGCEVRWDESRQVYDCPCHDAVFDDAGKVVSGPPPRRLDRLPARIEGDSILLQG
jgi:Rieske Fe-S protein